MSLSKYMANGFTLTQPSQFEFQRRDQFGFVYACPLGAACYAKDPTRQISGTGVVAALFPEVKDLVLFNLDRLSVTDLEMLKDDYHGLFVEEPVEISGSYYIEQDLANLVMMLRDGLNWTNDEILTWIREQGY